MLDGVTTATLVHLMPSFPSQPPCASHSTNHDDIPEICWSTGDFVCDQEQHTPLGLIQRQHPKKGFILKIISLCLHSCMLTARSSNVGLVQDDFRRIWNTKLSKFGWNKEKQRFSWIQSPQKRPKGHLKRSRVPWSCSPRIKLYAWCSVQWTCHTPQTNPFLIWITWTHPQQLA